MCKFCENIYTSDYKTPITKIIYTREKMAYLFTLQQAIVLWILIIKSIIALSAAESWCSNGGTFK